MCAGSGQVCVRTDRSYKRVWFITSSPMASVLANNGFFSYFFSPFLLTYYPLHYTLHRIRNVVLCHYPFVVFLSFSIGLRLFVSPYFRKTSPAVSCCRRVIKVNRNISVFFFIFLTAVRRFRVGSTQPRVSGDITQFRYTCAEMIAQCVYVPTPMNNILYSYYFI